MIHFFRKIRQNFIYESNVGKYLLYAIGEILLVVIGIIIAVQIGNWNEEKQERILENISLENLLEDLNIQMEIIEEQLVFESTKSATVDTALRLMNETPNYPELVHLLRELSSRRTFIANKATFDNLGATGNIVLIKNKNLQNSIIRYYQKLDYTTAVISNNNLFLIDSQFGNFVNSNGMGFKMNRDGTISNNQTISQEQRFTIIGQLNNRKSFSESCINITQLLLSATQELINQINEEIDLYYK